MPKTHNTKETIPLNDNSEEALDEQPQRRKYLKAVGFVWATPIVSSITLPTHAQTSPPDPVLVACTAMFNSDATFTVPAGATEITYTLKGASGGNGWALAPPGQQRTGGGGGSLGDAISVESVGVGSIMIEYMEEDSCSI